MSIIVYKTNLLKRMERYTVSKASDRPMNTNEYQLVVLKHGQLNDRSGKQIVQNIKYHLRSNKTLCAQGFWKSMGAQILVYKYLRHYCLHSYQSDLQRPILFLSHLEKHPFQMGDEKII